MEHEYDYEEGLLVKTAWFYYIGGYTQQEIGEYLGISRLRVKRLLDKARKNGIIRFSIRENDTRRMQVEQDFIRHFHLKDAFIVPSPIGERDVNDSIAQAAAMYLCERIDQNSFINIGYGDTTSRVLNYLSNSSEFPVNVVSLTGGMFSNSDFLLLSMKGAVGDILCHFIDKDGNLVPSDIEGRLISTPLKKLKSLENTIGVAAGEQKVAAILTALKEGHLNTLITDENTARSILAMDENNAGN